MRWIAAEYKHLVDMGRKHWRDAKTKEPISAGSAFAWIRDARNSVEVLDETPPVSVSKTMYAKTIEQILDEHGVYANDFYSIEPVHKAMQEYANQATLQAEGEVKRLREAAQGLINAIESGNDYSPAIEAAKQALNK